MRLFAVNVLRNIFYFLAVWLVGVPCRSWRVVKLSCVGSIGLSFMGTLRATQIRHDWKSKRAREREREQRECVEERKDQVGDITEDRAEREGGMGEEKGEKRGGWWHEWTRQREGKKMKCMLFPGSIINTVINEHGDQGSAPYIRSSSYRWQGEW